MKMNKITISRECGTGGRDIANRLGKELGLRVYDKTILEAVTEKYQLNKQEIDRIKAKRLNLWRYSWDRLVIPARDISSYSIVFFRITYFRSFPSMVAVKR